MAEYRSRISTIEKFAMVGIALLFDLVSLIPLLNIAVEIFAIFIFSIWFTTNGIPPRVGFKMGGSAAVSAVIGFIPVLSIIPEITLFILTTLYLYNKEEKQEQLELQAQNAGGTVEKNQRQTEEIEQPTVNKPVSRNREDNSIQNASQSEIETQPVNYKRSLKLYGREYQNGKRLVGARQGIVFGGGVSAGAGLLHNAKPLNFKDPRASKSDTLSSVPETKNDNELGLAA